jgi:hypothetical protein
MLCAGPTGSRKRTTLLQDGVAKTLAGWTDFKQVKAVP